MSKQGHGHGPMGRGGGLGAGGEKADDFKGTIKKLFHYLKPFHTPCLIVVIFAIASTVFFIVGPTILGNATNILVDGIKNAMVTGTVDIDYPAIAKTLTILACIYVCSGIFSYIQGWVMSGVSQKVTYTLRKDISEKINRMPLNYFDTHTNGEVLSRITNDVDTVSQTLGQSMTQIITSTATVIGVLIMMLRISWIMTLVALIVIPLSLFFVLGVVKKSQKYFRSQQEYLGHINGHVEENYGGHLVVHAFNGEDRAIKVFQDLNENLYNSAWRSQFLSGLMMPIMGFIGNLGYVMVCILGGYLAVRNAIDIGDI